MRPGAAGETGAVSRDCVPAGSAESRCEARPEPNVHAPNSAGVSSFRYSVRSRCLARRAFPAFW